MTRPIFPHAVKQMMKPGRRGFLKCSLGARSATPLIQRVATAREIRTVAICGDITSLYVDDLDLRWKQGPVWLTGLTTPASLFYLDLLARDRSTSDLVFWIIAPRARAAEQERANA